MTLLMQETNIDAVKGESNVWDLDATIPLDTNDSIWFTAKHRKGDADADAVLALTKAGGGITITDEGTGKFRVTSAPSDLVAVAERALVYDVKIKVAATGLIQTVAAGVLYLIDSVNKDAT
jgi:hypothetical protein